MRYLIVLIVVIAACAASVLKDPTAGYQEGDRYFYFPGDDGALHLVDTQESVDVEFLQDYARNPNNNEYRLFTRLNPTMPQRIELYDQYSLIISNFDPRKVTVIIAHGWNGSGYSAMNPRLTQVLLNEGDVNVIVLDWNELANRNYITARNGVPAVGERLGLFVSWLVEFGLSYDDIHLIGFSLGGHLMGAAGKVTGGRVARITALDPAGPLWSGNRDRLTESDARYVEVIHTNTFFLGYSDPCGDADFYPNGGSSQPGCFLNNCSHSRAVDLMVASITYDHFLANQCETIRDKDRNRCTGPLFPMGNSDLNKSGSGIFRVNTGSSYPF